MRGCRVIAVEKRVIAAARNAGARAARGEFLAFVDADAQVHPDTFVEIDRALADPRVVAEDVTFLWALRRLGQTRAQRLARATRAKIVASTRKFDEFGDWHFFSVAIEALRYLMRRDLTLFTASYWYKPNR